MVYDSTDNKTFSHTGSVSKITGNSISVLLKEDISCESCRIKGTCGIANSGSKEIEIINPVDTFKLHENVQVVLEKRLGIKAVFWAYLFPFILLISTLIMTSVFFKEWVAGLVSLLVLIPYYATLYLLKNSMKELFKISVLKYN